MPGMAYFAMSYERSSLDVRALWRQAVSTPPAPCPALTGGFTNEVLRFLGRRVAVRGRFALGAQRQDGAQCFLDFAHSQMSSIDNTREATLIAFTGELEHMGLFLGVQMQDRRIERLPRAIAKADAQPETGHGAGRQPNLVDTTSNLVDHEFVRFYGLGRRLYLSDLEFAVRVKLIDKALRPDLAVLDADPRGVGRDLELLI